MSDKEEVKNESLTTIFDGETDDIAEAEIVDESEEPTGEAEETEDKTEETEDAAPPAEEKKADDPDLEKQLKAQISKAKDEREKRKRYQTQLEQYQQQAKSAEKPDAFAEPDNAIAHAQAELVQSFDAKLFNMSEYHAKKNHSDFEEMADLFYDKLQIDNPLLADQARAAPDVCEFIYETAKNHVDMAELNDAGGVQALIDKKVAEERLKWETELDGKKNQDVEDAITKSIPGSLSTKRAAGSNKSQLQLDDKPLDKLF